MHCLKKQKPLKQTKQNALSAYFKKYLRFCTSVQLAEHREFSAVCPAQGAAHSEGKCECYSSNSKRLENVLFVFLFTFELAV